MFSKKLLIVDDEKEVRNILSEFFLRVGYLVETAASGKAALKKLDTFVPNLVLLDYMMPGRSGLEIYPRLKKIFPYIRVIILTGRGSEEIAVQALKMGVDDYITKPFDLKKVRESVRHYLREQRDEIIRLNGKYYYPLESEIINRYEYLRLAHARPEMGVKTASSFFTFSRQDFYNYLNRFKKWGVIGLFGERELKKTAARYNENRLRAKRELEFEPFPFIEKSKSNKVYRLDNFLNWNDSAQVKLEMIRESATDPKPHVGNICKKYGITREAFYQNYRSFEAQGLFGLLARRKGRPRKNSDK